MHFIALPTALIAVFFIQNFASLNGYDLKEEWDRERDEDRLRELQELEDPPYYSPEYNDDRDGTADDNVDIIENTEFSPLRVSTEYSSHVQFENVRHRRDAESLMPVFDVLDEDKMEDVEERNRQLEKIKKTTSKTKVIKQEIRESVLREIAEMMFPDNEEDREDAINNLKRLPPKKQYEAAIQWGIIKSPVPKSKPNEREPTPQETNDEFERSHERHDKTEDSQKVAEKNKTRAKRELDSPNRHVEEELPSGDKIEMVGKGDRNMNIESMSIKNSADNVHKPSQETQPPHQKKDEKKKKKKKKPKKEHTPANELEFHKSLDFELHDVPDKKRKKGANVDMSRFEADPDADPKAVEEVRRMVEELAEYRKVVEEEDDDDDDDDEEDDVKKSVKGDGTPPSKFHNTAQNDSGLSDVIKPESREKIENKLRELKSEATNGEDEEETEEVDEDYDGLPDVIPTGEVVSDPDEYDDVEIFDTKDMPIDHSLLQNNDDVNGDSKQAQV